jgi:hypothetical protein
MKRTLTFAATVALFASITVVTAVTFAQRGDSPAKDSRQSNEASGVAAMCVQDHPDCNDMIVGGTGGGSANACTRDNPDCNDTSFGGGGPIDSGPSDGSGNSSSGGVTYDITVPFNASVTDEDMKLANEIVLAFDPNANFLLQETFPPTGRAQLQSDSSEFCSGIEGKLESIPSVGNVTCTPANPNPPCCKSDQPVSSTPAGQAGVNPSGPASPPDAGPPSE